MSRSSANSKPINRWQILLEDTLLVFIVTLLPKLLVLQPQNLADITLPALWEPILSSLLAALYTYMRLRGIDVGED